MTTQQYKYGFTSKVDLATHQAIGEYANKFSNGSISAAVRELIKIGLEEADSQGQTNSTLRLAFMQREKQRIASYQIQLADGYISLQQNFDPDFEQALKDFAADKGLKYPPDVDQLNLWDIDPKLRRTLDAVKDCCNGSGQTTLREVERRTNSGRGEVLSHLAKLRECKQVKYSDTKEYSSCVIELC